MISLSSRKAWRCDLSLGSGSMILLVPLPDQTGETMRPVTGPRHPPPPPGPGRRCPGNGGCALIGCRGSTR